MALDLYWLGLQPHVAARCTQTQVKFFALRLRAPVVCVCLCCMFDAARTMCLLLDEACVQEYGMLVTCDLSCVYTATVSNDRAV